MRWPCITSPSPNRNFVTGYAQEYCRYGCLDGADILYNNTVTDCTIGNVTKDCRCDLNAPTNECVKGRSPNLSVVHPYLSVPPSWRFSHPWIRNMDLACNANIAILSIKRMHSHAIYFRYCIRDSQCAADLLTFWIACAKAARARWCTVSERVTRQMKQQNETSMTSWPHVNRTVLMTWLRSPSTADVRGCMRTIS